MTSDEYVFTSESVSEGHPDKICDRISDAVLDVYMASANPKARVACECLVTTNCVILAGEVDPISLFGDGMLEEIIRSGIIGDPVTGPPWSGDGVLEEVVRRVVRDIGYEKRDQFHWEDLKVLNFLNKQSGEIAAGVNGKSTDEPGTNELGAGDQGLMFGYAVDETEDLMPAPIHYSHAILRAISEARRTGRAKGIGPDGKVQLSVVYQKGQPQRVQTIVLSHQHDSDLKPKTDVQNILEPIVEEVLPKGWLDGTKWLVNPSGSFTKGGPAADAGLTGRKIIVDTYGGAAPHGGGAFSGKDPTKVDRSAAYAARYLAKNVVAAGLARRCQIQISYAIGDPEPVSVMVETYGTGKAANADIERAIRKELDLRPKTIRNHLDLLRPIYERTSSYGHFGRRPEEDGGFSWERVDLADRLRDLLG